MLCLNYNFFIFFWYVCQVLKDLWQIYVEEKQTAQSLNFLSKVLNSCFQINYSPVMSVPRSPEPVFYPPASWPGLAKYILLNTPLKLQKLFA